MARVSTCYCQRVFSTTRESLVHYEFNMSASYNNIWFIFILHAKCLWTSEDVCYCDFRLLTIDVCHWTHCNVHRTYVFATQVVQGYYKENHWQIRVQHQEAWGIVTHPDARIKVPYVTTPAAVASSVQILLVEFSRARR